MTMQFLSRTGFKAFRGDADIFQQKGARGRGNSGWFDN